MIASLTVPYAVVEFGLEGARLRHCRSRHWPSPRGHQKVRDEIQLGDSELGELLAGLEEHGPAWLRERVRDWFFKPRENNSDKLSAADVAKRLGVSRSHAYGILRRIPERVRAGSSVKVPEKALTRWLARGGDKWRDQGNESPATTRSAASGTSSSTTRKASSGAEARASAIRKWRTVLERKSSGRS